MTEGWAYHKSRVVCRPRFAHQPVFAPIALVTILLTRLNLAHLARPDAALPDFMRRDAVARNYLAPLGPLDGSQFLERSSNPVSDLRPCPHIRNGAAIANSTP